MKKILVISWFYPPINSSEGLVTYKLLKNSELKYDVFMQANSASWSYGMNDDFPEAKNVSRIFSQSDNLEQWKKEAVKYYKQHREEYDIVMTRSMPPESHEVGLEIKKNNPKVKWIASFGDPIANNPFVLMSQPKCSPYSLQMRYVRKMGIREMVSPKRMIKNEVWKLRNKKAQKPYEQERLFQDRIAKNCDYMIMNSEEQKEYMLGTCDEAMKNKAIVLPHSFDESLYGKAATDKSEKIKIVYVGHLDNIRTPRVLLKALKELRDNEENLGDKLELLFYGNLSAKDKVYLIDNDLLDIVKIKKPVTYLESLRIMESADWLFHVDANLQEVLDHNIFFAAKLADYIGSGTPIMGVTMTEGPSANILRDLDALIMSYSVDEIKNYLHLIVNEGYTIEMNPEAVAKYDAKNVAKKFDGLVKTM